VFQRLDADDMLCLDGYHLLGVYHHGESYDYAEAATFLDENPGLDASLHEVSIDLKEEELFSSNAWSKDFRDLFLRSEGAFLMGGPDIPPSVYGEKTHLLTSVSDPWRHYMELSFTFHLLGGSQNEEWKPWLKEDKRYLLSGICLGMQSMNVATGGTLVQDIPTELYGLWTADELLDLNPDEMHRNYADKLRGTCVEPTSYHFHRIQSEKGSFLTKRTGFSKKGTPLVLSSHHQAIEKQGKGWKIAAYSMDGKIIEAIQHRDYPNVSGVQFHPEKPGLFDPSLVHPSSCGDSISFRKCIVETDAWDFHQLYWHHICSILEKRSN